MKYLVGTQELGIKLKSDKKGCLKQYLDVEFSVHLDYKYHMGATVTMGKVVIVSIPHKKTEHKEHHGCGVSL